MLTAVLAPPFTVNSKEESRIREKMRGGEEQQERSKKQNLLLDGRLAAPRAPPRRPRDALY